MADAAHYRRQVTEVLGAEQRGKAVQRQFSWDGVDEAKVVLAQVRQMQKRLRLIKTEVNAEMKAIRTAYSNQISSVSPGLGATVLLGKGGAKSMAASEKRSIRSRRDARLRPYGEVKRFIDEALVELDRVKHAVSESLESERLAVKARKAEAQLQAQAGPQTTILDRDLLPGESGTVHGCPACGAEPKRKGQQFCTSCGAKLTTPATSDITSEHGDVVMLRTSRGTQYKVEIHHRALGQHKTIKGDDLHIVEQKARTQMKQWNEAWRRREEKERAARSIVDKKALAEARNREAQEALMALETLLV